MNSPVAHRVRMAKLARIARRRAELAAEDARLLAEEATVFVEMAEGTTVNLATGKRRAAEVEPEIPQPSDLAVARASKALQIAALRRRVRQ